MHYLDPAVQVVVHNQSSGVHSGHDVHNANSSSSVEHGTRKLTGVLADYEHYLRSGGRSDFNTWARRKFADIVVPQVVLPKSLYIQRTRRTNAPIGDILNSTNPLASKDVTLVEAAVQQLRALDEAIANQCNVPLQKTPTLPQMIPEKQRHENALSSSDEECAATTPLEENEPPDAASPCVIRSQRNKLVVTIARDASLNTRTFKIKTDSGISSQISAYALLMEIVTLSDIYDIPISCSARILSVRDEMVETYARVGNIILDQLMHHLITEGQCILSPRIVAQGVLQLRPMLREAVIDTLAVECLCCGNMAILLWLCRDAKKKAIYDLYDMPSDPCTNGPIAPICTLKELKDVSHILARYLTRKHTTFSDNDYFLLRRIVDLGVSVCYHYWGKNLENMEKQKFTRFCFDEIMKCAPQYYEAWEDIVEFILDKSTLDNVARPDDIHSTVTLMKSIKCTPFVDNFFIRYAASFAHLFYHDSDVPREDLCLQQKTHPDQWNGVMTFLQQYKEIFESVYSSMHPQVQMHAGEPLLESYWVVGAFFAQLSVTGAFECSTLSVNRAALKLAHEKIKAEIDHIAIYWPNIRRGELMKELLQRTSYDVFAENLHVLCAALLPWTATAILFVRASPGNLAIKYPSAFPPVTITPVQSYESNSVFDFFVQSKNGIILP